MHHRHRGPTACTHFVDDRRILVVDPRGEMWSCEARFAKSTPRGARGLRKKLRLVGHRCRDTFSRFPNAEGLNSLCTGHLGSRPMPRAETWRWPSSNTMCLYVLIGSPDDNKKDVMSTGASWPMKHGSYITAPELLRFWFLSPGPSQVGSSRRTNSLIQRETNIDRCSQKHDPREFQRWSKQTLCKVKRSLEAASVPGGTQ